MVRLFDGDRVIAILAEHAHNTGVLSGGGVVTTVMSNMGLERYLGGLGLAMFRAAVGDRYVLEMMRSKGCNFGGEQSGHMILLDHNTTGDGLMTALQLLSAMSEQKKLLADMAVDMTLFPQKMWNIVMPERKNVLADTHVMALVRDAETRLGNGGRINVRMSGTEPKLRIMIEAEDEGLMLDIGEPLMQSIRDRIYS